MTLPEGRSWGEESSCGSGNLRLVSNSRRYRKPECIGQRVGVYRLDPNDSGMQPNARLISDQAGNPFGTGWLVIRSQQPLITGFPQSAILATCTSNPVFGSSDVSANTLNPSPLTSVWR